MTHQKSLVKCGRTGPTFGCVGISQLTDCQVSVSRDDQKDMGFPVCVLAHPHMRVCYVSGHFRSFWYR